ncbi:MAG: T9SS type A sorting domain-containing protein [Saprospiraceae bacterium]|nr:T9SS type A sorting domain-containing protein [Saprospiraceae bacterium]
MIKWILKKLLLLFPNPASNFVTIKYADFSIVSSILILDASGKIYTTFSLPDISHKSVQLDISSLPSGIYFVELRDQNNGFLEAKKFIKQ